MRKSVQDFKTWYSEEYYIWSQEQRCRKSEDILKKLLSTILSGYQIITRRMFHSCFPSTLWRTKKKKEKSSILYEEDDKRIKSQWRKCVYYFCFLIPLSTSMIDVILMSFMFSVGSYMQSHQQDFSGTV